MFSKSFTGLPQSYAEPLLLYHLKYTFADVGKYSTVRIHGGMVFKFCATGVMIGWQLASKK